MVKGVEISFEGLNICVRFNPDNHRPHVDVPMVMRVNHAYILNASPLLQNLV